MVIKMKVLRQGVSSSASKYVLKGSYIPRVGKTNGKTIGKQQRKITSKENPMGKHKEAEMT